jgi:hypothetical protein
MGRLQEIINGFRHFAFKSPEIEEMANNRAKICATCEKMRRNNTCRVCGCYVPAKVRSEKSRCPLKKW